MTTARWDVDTSLVPFAVQDTAQADDGGLVATAFDQRAHPGARWLLVLYVQNLSAGDLDFVVEDAEDDGTGAPDTYAAATTHGTLTTDADGVFVASFLTKKDRPFVQVTATCATALATADVTVLAIPVNRV